MTIAAPRAPAPPPQAPSQPAAEPNRSADRRWRRWRTPLAIGAVVVLGLIVIAIFGPSGQQQTNTYLYPLSTGATGTRALADTLAERGTHVVAVSTVAAASAAVGRGATTIVITSPELLTRPQLELLAGVRADLVLVEPDPAALRALAPAMTAVGIAPIAAVRPGCNLPAAVLAGNADMGGIALRQRSRHAGQRCYLSGKAGFLLQYPRGSRQVTVFGTGAPLENQDLDKLGNAALALNVLGNGRQIAWLTPQLAPPVVAGGPKSIWSIIPLGAYLVGVQFGVALLLAALWRSRRLGPLSVEHLPVVVRASETTEGHARLYQARRSRDRAAAALREAAARRLSPALGLPAGASAEATTAALAARSARGAPEIHELLFGRAPASDGELVKLAQDLDAMEREVRAE